MTLVRTQNRSPRMFDLMSSNVFRNMDRMFEEVSRASDSLSYPADLFETDDKLVLELAVPGLRSEDLDISVEDRQLTVSGSTVSSSTASGHSESGADEERRYWLQGIPRGEFSRNLRLPKSVDVDAISAQVSNGILTLTMPKAAEAQVKKIEVQVS